MPSASPIFIPSTDYAHSFRRGSLTQTIIHNGSTKRPPINGGTPFHSKHDRRWKWWHYLILLLLLFAFIELAIVVIGYALLHDQPAPISIALRKFPSVPYKHLDTRSQLKLERGTTVYHVTKEFGPASMGGMGMVLTALATAQQQTNRVDVSVIMPYYSYLKNKYDITKVSDLTMEIRDKNGHLMPVEFRVSKLDYAYGFNPENTNATTEVPPNSSQVVPVYLIGPGNKSPFNRAFRVKNVLNIYSSPNGLPQEWKDQYFCKAVATFLTHQVNSEEQSLFAPVTRRNRVDVVHLHGATNAYVAKHLRESIQLEDMGPKPPSIVYTMHDYLDELQYTNTISNVRKFIGNRDIEDAMSEMQTYMHGHRMFMSSLAIDSADVVTIVSKSMAKEIVEGRLDFYLKELVMDSLLRKAQKHHFFGVSNGVDFTTLNPFTSKKLTTRKCSFPAYALDIIDYGAGTIPSPTHSDELYIDQQPVSAQSLARKWTLSGEPNDFVTTAKDRAKRFLVRRDLLKEEDLKRPVILFIGRFQYNKGLEFFEAATQYFVKYNAKFIIIGQRNNYPLEWVQQLQSSYPDNVLVISDAKEQRQWSVFFRAAADFVFVPSLTESFGLVAAEGLLFGAGVISSGVGGLKEFLVDRPQNFLMTGAGKAGITKDDSGSTMVNTGDAYNAYLFNALEPNVDRLNQGLEYAIYDAIKDYERMVNIKALREDYALRMVSSAIGLGWDRRHGPVEEYLHAYQVGLGDIKVRDLERHEIEEERELLELIFRDGEEAGFIRAAPASTS
ncbi:hypothetical protein BGW37DRAFT_475440 [Umbelopsis sp. PMI_123]|nr:hypothetical protein BGW37DRAFT_475440 [Umbelopsis sp. PMI_123]